MPHAYMVAVGPAAACTSSPVAVSRMYGSGPRPGRGGMLTARQESINSARRRPPSSGGGIRAPSLQDVLPGMSYSRRLSPPSAGPTAVGGGQVARSAGMSRAPAACSNAYASAISLGSLHRGPMNDRPTGSPETPPAGTEMAGNPATAAGPEV